MPWLRMNAVVQSWILAAKWTRNVRGMNVARFRVEYLEVVDAETLVQALHPAETAGSLWPLIWTAFGSLTTSLWRA